MWEFIKYCLYCLGVVISGAFGYNPEGMSLKNGIIGSMTLFVLLGVAWLFLYLIYLIAKRFR